MLLPNVIFCCTIEPPLSKQLWAEIIQNAHMSELV